MLFTPDNANKVMNGLKTQTRRLVETGDLLTWAGVPGESPETVFSHPNDIHYRERWQVFKTYAVQPGRGKPAIGRIEITAISKERLRDISEADALADGGWEYSNCPIHKSPITSFCQLWDSIYQKRPGLRWADNPEVWVIKFKPVGTNALPLAKIVRAALPGPGHWS